MYSALYSTLYNAVKKTRRLLTIAAAASANGAEVRIDGCQNLLFQLVILTMTGANQTQDFKIQHRLKSTDSWQDTGLAFTQVVVAGGATWNQSLKSDRPILPRVRIVNTAGGTTTTLTATVDMIYEQGPRGRFVNHNAIS